MNTEPKLFPFTIDPPHAMDLEQAYWAQGTPERFEMFVAITDITQIVQIGSKLDNHAKSKVFSRYGKNGENKDPLYPKNLSEGTMSLLPGQTRPVLLMTIPFEDSRSGKPTLEFTTIQSSGKFSFKEADEILKGERNPEHKNAMQLLALGADILSQEREKKGQTVLHQELFAIECFLDEDGGITKLSADEKYASRIIVFECSVNMNLHVAKFLRDNFEFAAFRNQGRTNVHGTNHPGILEDIKRILHSTAHIDFLSNHTEDDIELFAKKIAHHTSSRPRAVYATNSTGHATFNGLDYTQITAPIRNYVCLLVMRCVKMLIKASKNRPPYTKRQMEKMLKHANEVERAMKDKK